MTQRVAFRENGEAKGSGSVQDWTEKKEVYEILVSGERDTEVLEAERRVEFKIQRGTI